MNCSHDYIELLEVDHLSSDGCVICKAKCEDCGAEYLATCWPTHYRNISDLTDSSDVTR